MNNERSNGYAAGRESMQWAVERMGELEAENERLRAQIDRLLEIMECNDPGNARNFKEPT